MKYKVKFGKARCWNEKESKSNTRFKCFCNLKKAEKFLKRLHKFKFKDPYTNEFYLIAWTDLIKDNNHE